MPSLNRMARKLTLVFLTGVVFAGASSVSVQSKASRPRKNSAVRIEQQQDPGRVRPTPRPLINWLARANDAKLGGHVDLNSSSEFAVDAKLNSTCRLSHTEELIANAMTAVSDGSQVIVRFRASRTAVDEIISRLLGAPKT